MSNFKTISLSILAIIGIAFFSGGLKLAYTKVFGVAQEDARRQVFEQTQSFVEGKRQELIRYKFQYESEKDSTVKSALRYTILHSMSSLDKTKLEPSLQSFLEQIN